MEFGIVPCHQIECLLSDQVLRQKIDPFDPNLYIQWARVLWQAEEFEVATASASLPLSVAPWECNHWKQDSVTLMG